MSRLVASRPTETGLNQSSRSRAANRALLVACLVGLASFAATEFMHYLLVPDLGRRWERWLAESVSALVVALLTARLLRAANQLREATLLRMQVISEMNHHIRNALAAIALSADSLDNQQCIKVISGSVDRIEWALREILLRKQPLPEDAARYSRYFQGQRTTPNGNARQKTRESLAASPEEKLR